MGSSADKGRASWGRRTKGGWGMTAHYQVTKFFLSHGDMVRGFGEFRRRSFSWVGLRWLASCNAACHVKSVMCRWLWPTTLLRANQQPQQLHSIQSSKQSLATAGSAQLDARPCTETAHKKELCTIAGSQQMGNQVRHKGGGQSIFCLQLFGTLETRNR